MASKFKVNLDINKESYLVVKCKQNDDLIMDASMFEYGQKLDLSNKTINIKALKADDTYIIQSTNITKNNNKITAELERDFTRVPGKTKIEIVLEGSGKQNTTFSFYLEVAGSVIDGAIESSNAVTIIETLDNKIVEAVQVKEETEQLIQSGGAATKGDIQEVNSQLEQKAQQSEVDIVKNLKADKSNVYAKSETYAKSEVDTKVFTMANMGQDVKTAMTGGSVAVVGTDAVDTVNLKDKSATFKKRTPIGGLLSVIYFEYAKPININTTNKQITIHENTHLLYGKLRFTISEDIVIDYSTIWADGRKYVILYYNTATNSFRCLSGNDAFSADENELYVMSFVKNPGFLDVGSVFCNFKYTIDGNFPRINGDTLTNEIKNSFIICASGVPDIIANGSERSITFKSGTIICIPNKYKELSTDIKITFELTRNNNYLIYDYNLNTIESLGSIGSIISLDENKTLIGVLSFLGVNVRSINLPCDYNLNGEMVSRVVTETFVKTNRNKHCIFPSIPNNWYKMITDNVVVNTSKDINDIYNAYDELVSFDNSYVTKENLGLDSSGQYPINSYRFKYEDVSTSAGNKKDKPKIIIVTNVHGSERASTWSLVNFVTDLCKNWQQDEVLEFIHFNVDLLIVPLVNPWGYINGGRKNSNGVDINRNISYAWEEYEDTGIDSMTYKGTTPLSENETVIIKNLIDNNKNAVSFIDYHTNGTSGTEYGNLYWFDFANSTNPSKFGLNELHNIARYILPKTTSEGQKRFNVPLNSGLFGYVNYEGRVPTLFNYSQSLGIPSMTFECGQKFVYETEYFSNNIMKLNTEFVGNSLINIVRTFCSY